MVLARGAELWLARAHGGRGGESSNGVGGKEQGHGTLGWWRRAAWGRGQWPSSSRAVPRVKGTGTRGMREGAARSRESWRNNIFFLLKIE